MSTTIADTPASVPTTFALNRSDALWQAIHALPERVHLNREMACLLAESGLLPERYALDDGTLYADSRLIHPLPITREMYYVLLDADLIDAETELLEGVIIATMSQRKPHLDVLMFLHEWLISLFGFRQVRDQYPVDMNIADAPIGLPEPDIVVWDQPAHLFAEGTRTPDHVLLLVEVANTTLRTDKVIKAALYAQAGIIEYWIADTNARSIIVHRQPQNGTYQSIVTYTAEQTVSCLAKPEEHKRVDELIAP